MKNKFISLKQFVKLNNYDVLYSGKYSMQLIDELICIFKKYKDKKTLKPIINNINANEKLFKMICQETAFIDVLCNNNQHMLRSSLMSIRLYCICNDIKECPNCEICGKPLTGFLHRWLDGIHNTTCSNKCKLKLFKQHYSRQPSVDSIKNFKCTDEEAAKFTVQLKQLVDENPLSFFNVIQAKCHADKYSELNKFIYAQTQFLDFNCSFGTRCKYVIDEKHEIYKCNVCGKPIRRNFFATDRRTKFWCSNKCISEDDMLNQTIGQKNSKHRKGIDTKTSECKHKECKIQYKDSPIIYDDEKNQRIYEIFIEHQKTFKHWLKKDKELYDYFMKSTYPIDYTSLNIGTRLYWLMHKFQEFPHCKVCNRQLDFANVKMSKEWPATCSLKCMAKYVGKLTEMRHRNAMYDRMLNQSEIMPLYSRDFYLDVGPKYDKFNVKCKICGYEFTSAINFNFYGRYEGGNMFRCPYCYPPEKCRSLVEEKIFSYIKNDLGHSDAMHSCNQIISPYELDIYVPSKKTAFEFDGIRWHAIEKKQNIDYHLNKTKLCEENGVKLIHIWEDEWLDDSRTIKQLIKDILDKTYSIDIIVDNGRKLVDRSKFNSIALKEKSFEIVDELPPQIIKRKSFNVSNCGYFIVK